MIAMVIPFLFYILYIMHSVEMYAGTSLHKYVVKRLTNMRNEGETVCSLSYY